MRNKLVALTGCVLITACSGEPLEAPPTELWLAAKTPKTESSPTVMVEDALQRLLPALDATTAASLKGPLTTIGVVLRSKNKDYAALNGAITTAEAALAIALARDDDTAPDLSAIALVVSAVATK